MQGREFSGRRGAAARGGSDDRAAPAAALDTLTLTQEQHGLNSGGRALAPLNPGPGAPSQRAAYNDPYGLFQRVADLGAQHRRPTGRRVYIEPRAFCVEPDPRAEGLGRDARALYDLRRIARSLTIDAAARGEAALTDLVKRRSGPDALGNWRRAKAPSRTDIEALAADAFAALPEAFRTRCQGVAILVQDFPEQDVLDHLGIESPFDLLGLYEGVDLTQASVDDVARDLNRIYLYRRPLIDYWAEHDETLGDLVTHVLVHEIGHHFGLSDEEMAAIEGAAG